LQQPLEARRRLDALGAARESADFEALAVAFKRVKNLSRELKREPIDPLDRLTEPAELALLGEYHERASAIRQALEARRYDRAFKVASEFRPAVDRFFDEVFVMVGDEGLREQRLSLLKLLYDLLLELADISEVVPTVES
jgi:glycyl-tRNA synthetase beta chain